MNRVLLISIALLAAVACSDDSGETPDAGGTPACEGPNGPCIELYPEGDVDDLAQTALLEAQPGDIVLFHAGTYQFSRGLSLDIDNVTVRGEGMDSTILSFADQSEDPQGFLVTADNFVIEDIAIEDTPGDGLKIEGTTGVTIRRVRVEWTGGISVDNGAYGLYPVQCTDVLIEDSVAIAASDAGIYVGQSENIIVRRNRAEYNVAGIEIENSIGADVYENVATNNTGGLLIFSLPGLQVKNGRVTRAYNNQIYENNTDNFAPAGNIVGLVPKGSGIILLAAHEIEIFGNEVRDHQTANVAMISYLTTQNPYDDPEYDPFVDTIHIHDNTFGAGGETPVGALGAIVAQSLAQVMDPVIVPTILFDGVVNPAKADAKDPRLFQPEYNLCFQNNGEATYGNVDFGNPTDQMVSLDATPHDCAHTPLPAVTIAGVGE